MGDIVLEGVKTTKTDSVCGSNNEVTPSELTKTKGIRNPAMAYEAAMTSPTELLAPEAFPDNITDLNGNATCIRDPKEDMAGYRHGKSSRRNVRCLVLALVVFIIATCIMTGLFAWRMIAFEETETDKVYNSIPSCFVRASPVRFSKFPNAIDEYLETWREEIVSALKKDKESVALVNVVYYDKIIWQANYTMKSNGTVLQNVTKAIAYPVASVTKVITSLLAFKLYNDGNISMDDSVIKYEPEFSVQNPFDKDNGRSITIRYLISYLSGLPRDGPCYPDNKESYCPHNNSYVLQRLNGSTLLFSPGSDVLYGNLPFAVAGQAMSKNYPGGYRQLVHDKLFVPLGMKKSFFNLNETVRKAMYRPHLVSKKVPELKEWGWLDPAGGLLTTTDDLAQLEIALFNETGSSFLKMAFLREFFSPEYFFTDGKTMLGSPWDIRFRKGYLLYGKEGYVYGGYGSGIYLNPRLRLAINVLSTSSKVFDLCKEKLEPLTDLFHEELMKVSQDEEPKLSPKPERYVGDYYTTSVPTLLNSTIKISSSKIWNNTHHVLTITLDHYTFDLTYLGDNVFEILHKQCKDFFLGVNGEKIYFTGQKNAQDQMTEFVIYGIHLRGKATFYRKA